jgi:hypothetical protein
VAKCLAALTAALCLFGACHHRETRAQARRPAPGANRPVPGRQCPLHRDGGCNLFEPAEATDDVTP